MSSNLKTALVFGHSSGLGKGIATVLLSRGQRVVGIARSAPNFDDPNLVNLVADLSREDDARMVVEAIQKEHSEFDYLIFAAGTLTAHEIDSVDYDELEYLYKVNLFAPMFIESQLLDNVRKNSADILNVTSDSIVHYYPKFSEYSSSKVAFKKFTADLARTLLDTKSRVIEFCPGGFKSNIYKTMSGEKVDRDESQQMNTDDVAELAVQLLELPKKIEISHIQVTKKPIDG